MKIRILLVIVSLVTSVLIGLALAARGGKAPGATQDDGIVIGLSLDTLKEARWQADREMFVKRAGELGARVRVLAANSDDTVQISDVEKLITNKVDVLVIVPHDGTAMAKGVKMAHDAGIPVIAYDRMIRDSDPDLYVSFDNEHVGELQAKFLLERLPTPGKGRIVRIYGAKTDNNAALFKRGQDRVLEPLIKSGDIQVLHEDWAEDWKPENAKRIVNAAITANGPRIDAVLASNDGTAGGAIQALSEEGLAGKVLVTGQDAETVALQRIAVGTQAMTIYKPLRTLASGAAELAVQMAARRVVVASKTVDNGHGQVPAVLFDVITVTRDNILDTVVRDGQATYDDVYRGIPDAQRPPRP
ncbi:MAG: substrate-binding domain-containing protein [Gammaproteobacteria bacterium]|nr:substrate-binding domain-containing protein [Gammaproteobacteria bacterium]MDH5272598.1 substrate-binding domain-containing protein [Gammaproteobacteria bacterium]